MPESRTYRYTCRRVGSPKADVTAATTAENSLPVRRLVSETAGSASSCTIVNIVPARPALGRPGPPLLALERTSLVVAVAWLCADFGP